MQPKGADRLRESPAENPSRAPPPRHRFVCAPCSGSLPEFIALPTTPLEALSGDPLDLGQKQTLTALLIYWASPCRAVGRDHVPGRAPASFRSAGVGRGLRARGAQGLGLPAQPREPCPGGQSDSVPQPALRFHTIRGDCTSSSAFKGPHTLAASIKCSQRSSGQEGYG